MLKHTIKYTNFDDEEITEDFYFHISKNELVEMEVEHAEGLYEWLDKMIKAKDRKALFDQFKKIILSAYGEKSADGKSFVKPKDREQFASHAAFDALFVEMTTAENSDEVVANFIIGCLPTDMHVDARKAMEEVAKTNQVTKTSTDAPTSEAPTQ